MIPFLGTWACEERSAQFIAETVSRLTAQDMMALSASYSGDEDKPDPGYLVDSGIAILDLNGVLVKDGGWWLRYFGAVSTTEFAQSIRAADADPAVKCLWIVCDSPGGQVAGTPEAAESVMAASKPVVAFVSGMCCSGAYWICSQADHLYGRPESQNGNIGCYTYMADLSAMYEQAGIKIKVFRSDVHKGVGICGTATTEEQDAEVQRGIDGIAGLFKSAVGKARKYKPEKLAVVSDGRWFLGAEAKSNGLIDGVAGYDAVRNALLAYIPGRKAIHIAAESGIGASDMNLWQQLKSALGGDPTDNSTNPPPATQSAAAPYVPGYASAVESARIQQLESELEKERAEKAKIAADYAAADKKKAEAENRMMVAEQVKSGRITQEDIETHCALRASNPESYDKVMSKVKSHPLTPDVDKIDGATASERTEDPATAFSEAAHQYIKDRQKAQNGAKN